MLHTDDFTFIEDDGHIIPEVGSWANKKYKLVKLYVELFSKSMRSKWDHLVYIDLFSGAGLSRIQGTDRAVLSSPMIALEADPPFDKYIFCEQDPEKHAALKYRIQNSHSGKA